MSSHTHSPRWVRVALLACAFASTAVGTSLLAQQAQAPALAAPAVSAPVTPAPAAATVATTAPAPRSSTLFERNDPNAPTLASAQAAHEAAMVSGDNHTIVVSTLVLVLGVVILVLLIA